LEYTANEIDHLVHFSDQIVDLIFSVSKISTIVEVLDNRFVSSLRTGQLERPQSSADLSESWTNSGDLVNDIFNAQDVVLSEVLFNDKIGSDGDSVSFNLQETSLVNQLSDGLEVGVSISHVRLDDSEHVDGSLVESDKDGISDLSQSEQLKDLSWLGVDVVDTSDTNDQSKFGFRLNEEVSSSLGNSSDSDEFPFLLSVFLDVLFSSLEDDLSLGSSFLDEGSLGLDSMGGLLLLVSSLLQDCLRDSSCLCCCLLGRLGWCCGLLG